jgi:hypothetical protein
MPLEQLVYQGCHQEGFPSVLDWLYPSSCSFLWDGKDEGAQRAASTSEAQYLAANKGTAISKFRLNKPHKQCNLEKHQRTCATDEISALKFSTSKVSALT